MKVGAIMDANDSLLKFTEYLVSISEFSKGRTSKIFDDVKNKNSEYIVLKNNQPTAMLVSMKTYKELIKKAVKMEALLEKMEDIRLLKIAESRMENFDFKNTIDHDDFVRDMGFDPAEIEKDCESVEIE